MCLNTGMLKIFNITWWSWIYGFVTILYMKNVHAKIGYFWHITDLHLDVDYSTKGDVAKSCWHLKYDQTNAPNRRLPGRFGDYSCASPWSLLESATEAMKSRQGDNVEFILWTGDGLAHSARRLSEPHRLDLLRNITDLLGRTFSSQFVFPVLGHEDGKENNFNRLGELWRHWLPLEALQTFEKGGYYTIEQTKSRLRIIVLNTNFMRHDTRYQQHSATLPVRQRPNGNGGNGGGGGGGGGGNQDSSEYNNFHYYHGNHYRNTNNNNNNNNNNNGYNSGGGTVSALSGSTETTESQKQWDWLEEVLAKSNKNKETVYIVGHIPPGLDERQVGSSPNVHTTFSEKNNLRYLRLVRKYSTIILGQFFGHLHSDSFRIIYNDIGKPVSWIMIAPSVTPKKANVGSNNPAMRLYKFETDTGQVLDYTQYYLDLEAANKNGEAIWQSEYNLTTHYFFSGEVTAVALHNLVDRFPNTENPLFTKYYRANSVRYPTSLCEGVCALNHFCAITRVDFHEFKQCIATAASALASSSKSTTSTTISHIYIILATIFTIILYELQLHQHSWDTARDDSKDVHKTKHCHQERKRQKPIVLAPRLMMTNTQNRNIQQHFYYRQQLKKLLLLDWLHFIFDAKHLFLINVVSILNQLYKCKNSIYSMSFHFYRIINIILTFFYNLKFKKHNEILILICQNTIKIIINNLFSIKQYLVDSFNIITNNNLNKITALVLVLFYINNIINTNKYNNIIIVDNNSYNINNNNNNNNNFLNNSALILKAEC